MKTRVVLLSAAFVAAGLFFATFPVEYGFESRSRIVQLVKPSKESNLFGEEGERIGSPQRMVILDARAFMSNSPVNGAWTVDDNYLKANGIYPLQLQSVKAVTGVARIGFVAFILVSLTILALIKRKSRIRP